MIDNAKKVFPFAFCFSPCLRSFLSFAFSDRATSFCG
jgi:hypothetical protein